MAWFHGWHWLPSCKPRRTEGLIKKSPKFDKALVAALKEMQKAGILSNPRCVLDAIMVMLDVDPRAVVEIEQIFSSTN